MASSTQEQLRERRLKYFKKKKKQRHSHNHPIHINSDDDEDNEDIKMQQNDNDESTDSDTNDYEISYEPQLQTLETKIKEQERRCNQLYNKLKSETKKLSKYQAEYEHLKAMKNQSNSQQIEQNNNNNHNHHNHNDNDDYIIPPELIVEDHEQRQQMERQRMERQAKMQQDHDHEIAMQLQRQYQREERRQQQRRQLQSPHNSGQNRRNPPSQNRRFSYSSSSMSSSMEADNGNHEDFGLHLQAHHDRVHRLLNRDPYFSMSGSSPFSSSIRPSVFDQSAMNEINRHRMRTAHLFRNFDDEFDNMTYEQLSSLFPNVPRGADEDTIQRLPTDTFEEKQQSHSNSSNNNRKKKEEDENSKCCICMEKFQNGEEIRRLPCMHIFHKHEIDKWLRTNKVCPICRIDVETSSH